MIRFDKFIEKAFFSLVIAILGFAVKFLGELSTNVQDLNSRIAIIIEKVSQHDLKFNAIQENMMILSNHETRIEILEEKMKDEKQ